MVRILSNRVFNISIIIKKRVIFRNIILYRTYYINPFNNYVKM